jgi:dTDP-D-glucose 4,6-dehydratase
VPFETGLRQTIAWYQAHGAWLEHVLARQDSFLAGALALAETGEPAGGAR